MGKSVENKDKIAFVITRYGADINGGAEEHCRMLAERLKSYYEVEILTTCAKSIDSGVNEYEPGVRNVGGISVRYFRVKALGLLSKYRLYRKIVSNATKLHRSLSKHPNIDSLFSWLYKRVEALDMAILREHPVYSQEMFDYIVEHKDEYKVFIPVTYCYPPLLFTTLLVPEKSLLIPTLHDEKFAYRPFVSRVLSLAEYIAFNIESEKRLALRLVGKRGLRGDVVSVSFDRKPSAPYEEVKKKYNLPDDYVLFVGRLHKGKGTDILIDYFSAYKERYPEDKDLKIVFVGGKWENEEVHCPDAVFTGFISDEEKNAIIENCTVFVNPSLYESLSLIVLEGMAKERVMLLNGECEVLKEHCIKSNGAALYYTNKQEFIEKMHLVYHDKALREELGRKGREYVEEYYNWDVIMSRLLRAIDIVKK